MPKITFIEHDGTQHVVDAEVGKSVMQAAMDNLVPGIDADCGGECSCATCHVYVDEAFADKLPEMSEDENDLLDTSDHRKPTSRLSCQIMMSAALDGATVTIAPED